MDYKLLKAINKAADARVPVAIVTYLATGEQQLVSAGEKYPPNTDDAIAQAFRSGRSETVETSDGRVFIEVRLPKPKLLIIGAVHIAQALAPMAKLTGFDVTVVDPRPAFATPDRFEDGQVVICDWPEDYLKSKPLDAYMALACFTHEPNIDDDALAHALNAGCFYIGALGGSKSHGKRLLRLKERGFSGEQTGKINGPIGLDIGSTTPSEIAVSALAEIVQALRQSAS